MATGFGQPFRIKMSNNKNEFLEIDISGYLSDLARDFLNATKEQTKKQYDSILGDWVGTVGKRQKYVYAVADLRRSISDPVSYLNFENDGKTISATVEYWVDTSKMRKVKRADEWMAKWRDELKGEPGLDGATWQDLPSNEYRAQLMFEEGIVGLPKQSHFRRKKGTNDPYWVNPNQDVYMPLEKHIQSFNVDGSSAMQKIAREVQRSLKAKGY